MKLKGGGIIPITVHNGKLMLLLGRENMYCKNCCHKWSDWGGGKEINENIIDAVAREASEESMGFFGSKKEIKKILKTNSDNQYIIGDVYKYYIIPIDYDEKIPFYFNNCRDIINKYIPKNLLRNNKILEKDKMMWFTLEELENSNKLRKHFKNTTKKIVNEKDKIIDFFNNVSKKNNKHSTTKKNNIKKTIKIKYLNMKLNKTLKNNKY